MEVELEADGQPTQQATPPANEPPSLPIPDSNYVLALCEILSDLIPRMTVNLWDELLLCDQFRKINAQLEHLEEKKDQKDKNQDVLIDALAKAGAVESGIRDLIRDKVREELTVIEKSSQKAARKNLWPVPKPSHRGQTVVQILQVDLEDAEGSPASNRTLSLAAPCAIGTRHQASEAERRRRRTPKRKRSPKLPPKNPAQQELPLHKVVVEEVVEPKEVETLPTTQGGEEET